MTINNFSLKDNSLLNDADFVDQMAKRNMHDKNSTVQRLHIFVNAIENACRGGSLSTCRDYKLREIITEQDWNNIVQCHHGNKDKLSLSWGVEFDLNEYEWQRSKQLSNATSEILNTVNL